MRILEKELHPPEEVQLKVDDYVPVYLIFGDEVHGQLFCRYVTSVSLLEIGFSPKDKRLCSIKLVQSSGIIQSDGLNGFMPDNIIEGLVRCNIDAWSGKKLLDRKMGFSLIVGDSTLSLKLRDQPATKVVRNENVRFGCFDDDLVWILVSGINSSDMLKIVEVVNSQQDHGYL